ncbi:MAG: hypothetical protein RR466_13030 [Hungatella sp.]
MSQYTYSNSRVKQHTRSSRSDFSSLLLFYILPFIVINGLLFFLVTAKPQCKLTVGETNDYQTTVISFQIQSHLPTKNLSVTLNSEPLELTRSGKNTYTATVSHNGILDVYVENFNGMATTAYEHVNVLDEDPPSVLDYLMEDDILTLNLSDSQSGIDYTSIHAINAQGMNIPPLSVNKATATVTFPMDSDDLTVFAKDLSANEVQAAFSTHTADASGTVILDQTPAKDPASAQ